MVHLQAQYSDLVQLAIAEDELLPQLQYPDCRLIVEYYRKTPFVYAVKEGKKKYLGKLTSEMQTAIDNYECLKNRLREKRSILRNFQCRGFPFIDTKAEALLGVIAEAGFFRLRGVLIGTNAFLSYPAMFGDNSCFSAVTPRTNDVDLALFKSISVELATANQKLAEPFVDVIQGIGNFQPEYNTEGNFLGRWKDAKGFCIDLLAPFRRDPPKSEIMTQIKSDDLMELPSLETKALSLKYLDFLIHDEIRGVAMGDKGILVNLPQPGKFAIHKLLVSNLRKGEDVVKIPKDIAQASALIHCMMAHDPASLKAAWDEAWDIGAAWRTLLEKASQNLSDDIRKFFKISPKPRGPRL